MTYHQTPAVKARLKNTRQTILDAARQLVSEGGWQQAQIASVASIAGIATGTVYRHFASKAELFVEVLSTVSQREVDVLSQISVSEGSYYERLNAAISAFVHRAVQNPRLAYALIAEPCEREIDAARLKYRKAISEVIKQIIIAGQKNKEFNPSLDPDIAASVIVGGFMEGLIGPLSPLNHQQNTDNSTHTYVVEKIADQLCSSVSIRN